MKKIIKYLFLLTGGSFILASCNDFLDREPLDSVTPDNFFFTENDLAAYAVKHYNFTTHEGFNAGIWKNDNATDNQAATDYDKKWIPGQWKVPEAYDNPASNDPSFSSSSIGSPMFHPIDDTEHPLLDLPGTDRASQETAISGTCQQALVGICHSVWHRWLFMG